MCGIAGMMDLGGEAPERAVLEAMATALRHRGPDGGGVELGDFWGLAHRRLSIIGLDNGAQPLANEDQTVWLTFNGEIYNHKKLRRILEEKGHSFATVTDTEVLVHGYEEWGIEGLLGRLEGMFAFGLLDVKAKRLVLARDRVGQKPLVYFRKGSRLWFASELQSLRRVPEMPRDMDRQALADYLSLLYVPAPRTIYDGVHKLPPGSFLVFDAENPTGTVKRYWLPRFAPKVNLQYADAVAETRRLLEKAVAKRLESEVPLGAFLSGGIDSTAVVALMQKQFSVPVQTFTIGFAEAAYDERKYAGIAAADVGTTHRLKLAEPENVDLLRQLIRHHGEPYADSSMIPTLLLSQFTREHVTVALTGDGADETFGGYQRYQVMALLGRLRWLPEGLRRATCGSLLRVLPEAREKRSRLAVARRLLRVLGRSGMDAYGEMTFLFDDSGKEALLGQAPRESALRIYEDALALLERDETLDTPERAMACDTLCYLPGDVLAKVDIAAMTVGLEPRSPFLDHQLMEFVGSLPRSWRVTMGSRKKLLLDAVRDVMPPALLDRDKAGFGVPVGAWMRGGMRPLIEDLPDVAAWDRSGLLQGAAIKQMVDAHLADQGDWGPRLWSLLCLRTWMEEE